MACVYALISLLESDKIRYVGISKYETPDKRLKQHISKARKNKRPSYKDNWINSISNDGGEIIAIILETNLSWEEAKEREIFYIAHYRSLGHALTNLTDGGDGALGFVRSAESNIKTSVTMLGRKYSSERCANISASRLGKPLSVEHKKSLSDAGLGYVRSLQHQVRLNAANHQLKKTQCPQGHPYSLENTHIKPNGSRDCRECKKLDSRVRRARKKAVGLTYVTV